jgi:hypothetical protein
MDFLPSVLWDYAPAAPSIIALIISVIAIWNPFSGENKWVKRCAIVAAILGIAFTIGVRNHELEVGARERVNAEHRLSTLGQLIAEGDTIEEKIMRDEAPVDTDAVDAWVKKTEEFLSTLPGGDFVSRFRDYNGLPTPNMPLAFYREGQSGPHTQTWIRMVYRLARLQQFSQELSARVR